MMASCASCGGRHRVDRIDGKLVAEPCREKHSGVASVPSAQVEHRAGPSDRAGSSATPTSKSRYRATPTHVDGIRFASKGEAALYSKMRAEGYLVVPHVRFPLHVLTSPGVPASWFTPDMLRFTPLDTNVDTPGWPQFFTVEAIEFKGPKTLESRDYALRAKAFRATYPSIPLRTFRMVKGQLQEDA